MKSTAWLGNALRTRRNRVPDIDALPDGLLKCIELCREQLVPIP